MCVGVAVERERCSAGGERKVFCVWREKGVLWVERERWSVGGGQTEELNGVC